MVQNLNLLVTTVVHVHVFLCPVGRKADPPRGAPIVRKAVPSLDPDGALDGATLGWFDPQRKMYKKIPINGQHEVIGMSGDIALYQGKPVVHTHMVVGS